MGPRNHEPFDKLRANGFLHRHAPADPVRAEPPIILSLSKEALAAR